MGDSSKELADLIDVCGVSEEDRLQVLGPKESAGEVPMEIVKEKTGKAGAWLKKKDFLKWKKNQSRLKLAEEKKDVRENRKSLKQVESEMRIRSEKKREQEVNREVKLA
jgi:hypothetical protein